MAMLADDKDLGFDPEALRERYRQERDRRLRAADLATGLVLAAMGVAEVHLVEADRRKAQFLREATRRMGLAGVTVHPVRIETLALAVDAVTARALAPLARLVPMARPLLRAGGRLVLLKGRGVDAELTALGEAGRMRVELHPSLADPEGRVLVLEEVASSAP